MATKVVMEALSPTMEEGRIVTWLRKEGDQVKSGDSLAEVETDKAIMEIVARGDGTLLKIVLPEGETAPVGDVVGIIGKPGEATEVDVPSVEKVQGREPSSEPAPTTAPKPGGSPAPVAQGHPAPAEAEGRIKASPLARRMARERAVDLAGIRGTGPGGRIIKRDVEGAPPVAPLALAAPGTAYEDVPLTQMRKTIAKRLAQSIGPIPTFYLTTEVDMERVAEAREALKATGVKVSLNDIILKAVALTLGKHPACNAWWQDDHIRVWHEVHLGVAVAIEDGLITPVLRYANQKPLRTIAEEVRDLAGRARERKLTPEEYTGATFSVSNLGMYGIDDFTAVINPPEAGILAVGQLVPKPVVHDGAVVVHRRLQMTMSCDHRVIDGATGAQFLQTLTRMLENPLAML